MKTWPTFEGNQERWKPFEVRNVEIALDWLHGDPALELQYRHNLSTTRTQQIIRHTIEKASFERGLNLTKIRARKDHFLCCMIKYKVYISQMIGGK